MRARNHSEKSGESDGTVTYVYHNNLASASPKNSSKDLQPTPHETPGDTRKDSKRKKGPVNDLVKIHITNLTVEGDDPNTGTLMNRGKLKDSAVAAEQSAAASSHEPTKTLHNNEVPLEKVELKRALSEGAGARTKQDSSRSKEDTSRSRVSSGELFSQMTRTSIPNMLSYRPCLTTQKGKTYKVISSSNANVVFCVFPRLQCSVSLQHRRDCCTQLSINVDLVEWRWIWTFLSRRPGFDFRGEPNL